MQCGKERALPPRRPSVTLSYASSSDGHHHDVYGSKKSVTRLKQVSTPPKERGKRKLLRRRESSDEVRRQLQQVRIGYRNTPLLRMIPGTILDTILE